MTIVDYFFDLGLIIAGLSFGVFLGSLVKHFTDLRKFIPRLFDEYRQEELSDNLAKLDKSLVRTVEVIFFSGFFVTLGLFISYFSVLFS
ncbi:hypothetical protein CEE45_15910 [Candidatus Heimdallarchaeota archaeon B3_Heim]|nr:MAG: hypothetical protein CEE45_15910 [Candidatus Heimdallarchaeota archaeon B3_Heim]